MYSGQSASITFKLLILCYTEGDVFRRKEGCNFLSSSSLCLHFFLFFLFFKVQSPIDLSYCGFQRWTENALKGGCCWRAAGRPGVENYIFIVANFQWHWRCLTWKIIKPMFSLPLQQTKLHSFDVENLKKLIFFLK